MKVTLLCDDSLFKRLMRMERLLTVHADTRRERSQHALVGIAVRAAQRGRWRLELEPLQKRLVLGMVSPATNFDRHGGFRQALNRVAHLQIILAISILREPPGGDAVNSVATNKRIIQTFGNFMTQSCHIFEPGAE